MAGEVLVEIGLNRVRDSQLGQDLLERIRKKLVALVEAGRLVPKERVAAGNALVDWAIQDLMLKTGIYLTMRIWDL